MHKFVDTHTHLFVEEFDTDRDAAILRKHNITGPILQIIEDMSSTLNTNTHKHTYLVAQLCGGIQEDPEQYYIH